MKDKITALGLVVVLGASLTGCSASATPQPSAPPTARTAISPEALQHSYKLVGGGKYATGTIQICSLKPGYTLYLEGQPAPAAPGEVGQSTNMLLQDGKVAYATVWGGNGKVATGVTKGTGSYVINTNSTGVPISITGTGTVSWHDQSSNTTTKRSDQIMFTMTQIAQINC